MGFQIIWTRGAIDDFRTHSETKRLLAHRISNLNQRTYDVLVSQLRYGTPYIIVVNGQQHGAELNAR